MITVSEAVATLVTGNAFLRFGLYHRLLNLAQTARFIRPMIESQTGKAARRAAISMALSRLQNEFTQEPEPLRRFRVDRINLHAGLAVLTFPKLDFTQRNLQTAYARLGQVGAYVTLTEGTAETTMIFDRAHIPAVIETMGVTPVGRHDHVSGLGVRFHQRYGETPGLIYELLQQLAVQRINVVEIASTRTELNIYLHEEDVRKAFDSLYAQFVAPRE